MRSRAGTVPTNTHNSKVVNMRSIGAQEPALRRRTGLWGAVGNLSVDGDLWHLQKQPHTLTHTTRGGCEPIHNSAVVLPSGSARVHAVGAALDRDPRCSRRAAHSARRELGVSFSISPVTRRGVGDRTRPAQRDRRTKKLSHWRRPRRCSHLCALHPRLATVCRRECLDL